MASSNKNNCRMAVFAFPANKKHEVFVAGSFNDWEFQRLNYSLKDRAYIIELPLKPGIYEYKFVVDGEWQEDKNNQDFVANDFGTINSILRIG